VLIGLLGSFGAQQRETPLIDAAARLIEQGFLGR
jgi:hypothetical protein